MTELLGTWTIIGLAFRSNLITDGVDARLVQGQVTVTDGREPTNLSCSLDQLTYRNKKGQASETRRTHTSMINPHQKPCDMLFMYGTNWAT